MNKRKFLAEVCMFFALASLVSSAYDLSDAKEEAVTGIKTDSVSHTRNSSEEKTISEVTKNVVPVNAGVCTNKYFPIAGGAKWRYKVTSTKGSDEYTYTVDYRNGADRFVQIQDIIRGSAAELKIDWLCLPEGLLTAKYGQITGNPKIGMNLDSKGASGITLPKETDWQIGKKWTSAYDLGGTFEMKPLKGAVTGKAVLSHEILSLEEKVKAAAGEYEAAKVKTLVSLQVTFQNRKLPAESVVMTNWYAPNVGLVKQEVTGTMGKMTMDYLGK